MILSSDITARLKGLRQKRAQGFAGFQARLLRQWAFVLLFGLLSLLLAAGVSAYRFYYWNHIEDHLADGGGRAAYDEAELAAIFAEYDARAAKRDAILGAAAIDVAASPALAPAGTSTSTPPALESAAATATDPASPDAPTSSPAE